MLNAMGDHPNDIPMRLSIYYTNSKKKKVVDSISRRKKFFFAVSKRIELRYQLINESMTKKSFLHDMESTTG